MRNLLLPLLFGLALPLMSQADSYCDIHITWDNSAYNCSNPCVVIVGEDYQGTLYQYDNNWMYVSDFTAIVPEGTYTLLCAFQAIGTDRAYYIDIKEGIEFPATTELTFSPGNCANKVSFRPSLPSGEAVELPVIDRSTGAYITEGNMQEMQYVNVDIFHKDLGALWSNMSYFSYNVTEDNLTQCDYWFPSLKSGFGINYIYTGAGRDNVYYTFTACTELGDANIHLTNTTDFIEVPGTFNKTPAGEALTQDPNYELCAAESHGLTTYVNGEYNSYRQYQLIGSIKTDKWLCAFDPNYSLDTFAVGAVLTDTDYFTIDSSSMMGGTSFYPADVKYTIGAPALYLNGKFVYDSGRYAYNQEFNQNGESLSKDLIQHPNFGYTSESGEPIYGNSTPIFVSTIKEDGPTYLIYPEYVGRYNEIREADTYLTQINWIDPEGFSSKMEINKYAQAVIFEKPSYYNEADMTFLNENVEVDGIAGYNLTKLHFVFDADEFYTPALRHLVFRDGNGKITDRLSSSKDSYLDFSAGDFSFDYYYPEDSYYPYGWYDYNDVRRAVAYYAPNGTDEWSMLDTEEVEGSYVTSLGTVYQASLGEIESDNEDKWYDLMVILEDKAGNWQEQILSPAFCIEGTSGVNAPAAYKTDTVEYYNLQGIKVTNPKVGNIYIRRAGSTTEKVVF